MIKPTVSVIIPSYKRPHLLDRAIKSVLSNNMKSAIEIIVIDDDPAMSGFQIVEQYANIRYIAKRGVNRGLSASRNLGIDIAEGDYLVFLDDDDCLCHGALRDLNSAIHPLKSFYYGNFIYCRPSGNSEVSLSNLDFKILKVVNQIPIGSYMIRKSSIRSKFDTSMRSHEDWMFILSNIDQESSLYVNQAIVAIDKTSETETSMQNRRRGFFWMEFIGIYSKFPEPTLAGQRQAMLKSLGIDLPINLLEFIDTH